MPPEQSSIRSSSSQAPPGTKAAENQLSAGRSQLLCLRSPPKQQPQKMQLLGQTWDVGLPEKYPLAEGTQRIVQPLDANLVDAVLGALSLQRRSIK